MEILQQHKIASLGFGLCLDLLGDMPPQDVMKESWHAERAANGPQVLALQDHKMQVVLAPVVVVLKCINQHLLCTWRDSPHLKHDPGGP